MKSIMSLFICVFVLLSCKNNDKAEIENANREDKTEVIDKTETIDISKDTLANAEMTKEVANEKAEIPSEIEVIGKDEKKPELVKLIDVKDVDHSLWNALLKKYVSASGKVNYKGFINDKVALQSYLDLLSEKIPANDWSKNAKLAYWINVYNAFTVKLIVDNYPLKSINDINNPWKTKFFSLQGKKYSLEEVENDILRKMNEPRIHFAINCASFSCPNLLNQAYTSSKLESQLQTVTKSFINDTTKNKITSNEIKISEIFNWYAADFKTSNTSIIDYLNKFSTIKIDDNAKVSFMNYDWSLNN